MHLLLAGAALTAFSHNVGGQNVTSSSRPSVPPSWAALNSSLDGRLARGTPWAKPCYSLVQGVSVTPDAEQCAFVQENYFNNHFNRSHAFGAYSAVQFETCMATGDQCLLNWLDPTDPTAFTPPADCKQGSVSPYYIDVKSQDDVIKALDFVKKTGVTLVIKNTGHDFQGRSAAPNSLALWMLHLNSMSKSTTFVPAGCKRKGVTAITVAAGVQFADLYAFADKNGLEIVGGTDETVGAAGGYLQGGGHSSISPSSGLAVDRALQFKIVTPDGSVRIANACQNSDLFWALRGGGGGTFGIVLEATVLATPRRSYQIASINWPVNNDNLEKIIHGFVDNATALSSQGWGGYLTPSAGSFVITNPLLNAAEARQSVQYLIDLSTSLGGVSNVTEVASFQEWFNLFISNELTVGQDSVGLPTAMTSRLIPKVNHDTAASRSQLVGALLNAMNNTLFSQIHFTAPFAYNATSVKDTSVNPIWRSSLYQVILVNSWFTGDTLADRQGAYAASTKAASFLRDITPGSGAYHNEADIHEPNFETSFWGDNYPRLLSIKKKYDPQGILDCWHCIGWKGANQKQYQCYI